MSDQEEKSPFTEHLGELRDRLIHAFIAVGLGFVAAYFFKEQLFDILTAPLVTAMAKSGNATLIFTGLPEAFFTYLKVALLAGIILATPVLFYEFWMFISPGLYRDEKKYMLPIIILSLIFFIAGASFGYFIVFPYGFEFFLGFTTETIQAMPSMKEYLSFASKMLLAFGFVFELPLVLTFLARMGIVTPAFLKKNRKYALLLFFVGAAIITPPDVVTQIMMAMPLILLYEIGILGAKIFGKKSKLDDENNDEEEQEEEIHEFDEDSETDDIDSKL
ncbi:twin-arginine translocase subunit TatC [Desulfobacter hydrogenophilus]|uniref:Sec-independent protein translocase protein TatC n=1 Tax=Desulfobacter hydrogenophilus TaxID=2291 RepID=A0A328FH82_9BACT|nr:twin-arginine translocase subunit TatC [Desulfobacter hydrogenophilus]NDY71668.1 twin-arginine translocase subunit TatC [Desulfobacter hydrogenophilus]QBH13182.1 twin-arginine translocase subunit TatC [Desulfobacter hydrogenophilus]RAM02397.1 twin-arginine translocase subunit TatC [Desulfobacter hydrogenophilus]